MLTKKWTTVLVGIMGMLLLIGCGTTTPPPIPNPNPEPTTGSLKVTLDFPSTMGAEPFDSTQLQYVKVTITQSSTTYHADAVLGQGQWTASFTDLRTGGWTIQASVRDAEGYEAMTGQGSASVQAGTLTNTHLGVNFLPGDLNLNVAIPDGLEVSYGTITITNPESGEIQTKDLVIANGTGSVSFTGLVPTSWEVLVKLLDATQEVVASGTGSILVQPGRALEASIQLDASNGSLEIDITWAELPSAPTGLQATSDGYTVQLNWTPSPEANISGYMVYRSDTNDPTTMIFLTPLLTTETNFMDTDITPGETYWYWVQAYNSYGYSSSLTEPVSVIVQ